MRACHEKYFLTHDGVELFYRYWPAVTPSGRALVMLHRGHEHSGRMAHLVDELGLDDFAVFAWDARGHGRSPGVRGFSPSVAASVRDIQAFVEHITSAHAIAPENLAVIAQSVGAVLAAIWVHDYAPKIRCLVLASPAFRIKLYVPFARPGLRFLRALRGDFFVNSYVKAEFLTHDAARIASYRDDPLIARPISVSMLLGLDDAARRTISDAAAITVPTQLLISGADWVVDKRPQHEFFRRLGSPCKEKHVLDGFYHDTLGEKERDRALVHIRGFLRRHFATQFKPVSLLAADKQGFTKTEFDRLAAPLTPLSPRSLYWGVNRLGLKVAASLSRGVQIGYETGFDSGATLDYVYRNQRRGKSIAGRAIDGAYLGAVGWCGIRKRKQHVEELIGAAMTQLRQAHMPVHIMDVAAGHGRYVVDALKGKAPPDSILLREYSEQNVAAGAQLIAENGLGNIATFVRGDAFDANSLAAVTPKPTLCVVSGLYELFPENDLVRRSLSGIGACVPAGGYLVYTGQPWHPQLEFIARVLISHRAGRLWVMRRRTQAELDQLVEAAGFTKLDQRIDERGIFSVSLARRNAA